MAAPANSPWAGLWNALIHAHVGPDLPRVGHVSLHFLVADGAMALFFLLVGLEVKREWLEGRLAKPEARRLPIIAAVAGMAVPALVYLAVTRFDPALRPGWAIPAATDIAFAVGILALLGPRAPPSLKLLLVTIAIIDDIGAVIIIALAYTRSLDVVALGAALVSHAWGAPSTNFTECGSNDRSAAMAAVTLLVGLRTTMGEILADQHFGLISGR